jgi:pyroglutamyl-peptidase
MKPTLLITGFGPFPAAPENPSGHLVGLLQRDGLPGLAPLRIGYAVLPTEWDGLVPAFERAVAELRPQLALHFGYSRHATGFQLEASAYNEACGRMDASGTTCAAGAISDHACARLNSPLPLGAVAARLATAGLPHSLSDDPGRYLCNNLYFRSLVRGITALFVHIPALRTPAGLMPRGHDGPASLDLDQAFEGARLIVGALASERPPATA